MNNNHAGRLQQVSHKMFHDWLVWGLVPLAACIVLTLLVQGYVGQLAVTERQLEIRFQMVFAVAAALFLLGFSLDSQWTNHQKLAKRIAAAALAALDGDSKRPPRLRPADLLVHSDIAFSSILTSTLALTIIGAAIGVVAIIAAAVGLGLTYAVMMILLSVSYQIFVFSRQAYYKEVMALADEGKLVVEVKDDEDTKKKS